MKKEYRPYEKALWVARHPKIIALLYLGIWLFVVAFWIVAAFLAVQFIKWAWNV
jgi:hypothetical protein